MRRALQFNIGPRGGQAILSCLFMHRCALLALICIAGCSEPSQKDIVDVATKSIESRQRVDGSRSVTFVTRYFYGDKVRFDSVNGKGVGFIIGIVLAQDGSVYYEIQDTEKKYENGQLVIYSGIYPDEVVLIEKGIENATPSAAQHHSPTPPFGNSNLIKGRNR